MEAQSFIKQYYHSHQLHGCQNRLAEIKHSIDSTGTYQHTFDELEYGAQLAWRHSNKCIGRLFWKSLKVIDKRGLSSAQKITQACIKHLEQAYNGGSIQPTITIFKAQQPEQSGITIFNHQLIRYAGFKQADGSVIGDPDSVKFTEVARSLGWQPTKESSFQVLPIAIKVPGQKLELTTIPDESIHEVKLFHPNLNGSKNLAFVGMPYPPYQI